MPEILRFTFIGTGDAFATEGRCWGGFVVNERYLFEAPPTALVGLYHGGVEPNGIEAVILSHHHADHVLGLPGLLVHWKHRGRIKPLTIIGPPGTEALTRTLIGAVSPRALDVDYGVDWIELGNDESASAGGLTVRALAVQHDERVGACLGYECQLGGRRFGYTGDTSVCEAVLGLAARSEVLISECSSRAEDNPLHMNLAADIPRLRAAMPTNSTLLLTHLGRDIDAGSLPNTLVARDFETFGFDAS